jgi:hypothetical protein
MDAYVIQHAEVLSSRSVNSCNEEVLIEYNIGRVGLYGIKEGLLDSPLDFLNLSVRIFSSIKPLFSD